MKNSLLAIALALALCAHVSTASATFVSGLGIEESKLYLDKADGITEFTGDVGSQGSGINVNVTSGGNVDVADGWATFKPSTGSTFTYVFFQPATPTLFGDFSTRGQLNGDGTVTIKVWDSSDFSDAKAQVFTFPGIKANDDFSRIGVISLDETIYQVEILTDADGGFKEVKQVDFSNAGTGILVPEPASLLLLGLGLIGIAGLRRSNR